MVFYGVGQRAFVLKDLSQVSAIHPAATGLAANEMRSGRSPDWLKFKNPTAPAVKREAEEDWR